MSIKELSFIVYGEPASKANSRKLIKCPKTGKPRFIKSEKALKYREDFGWQAKALRHPANGDVSVTMTIYYRTRRPDLDESLILDCLEGVAYHNDRQVKEKHIYHGLDKDKPRAEITVRCLKPK